MEIIMEHGPKYILTIHGLLKLLVIAFSCTTFALLADSGWYYTSEMKWVLAAFIISFSISTLFCFFRILGLSRHMSCDGPCSYDGFDFIWAWFSTVWCLSASIVFAANYPDPSFKKGQVIGSIIFAWMTFLAYAVESFFLRFYAPANIGFVATKPGWVKTALVAFGAATFGLMVDSGFNWCWSAEHRDSCDGATTYALVAFTVTWSITTIMWLVHLVAPKGSIEGSENFKKAEMIWAIVGILFFWSGASCYAAYMVCSGDDFDYIQYCQKRLSGVIAGFLTGALYGVELFMLRF